MLAAVSLLVSNVGCNGFAAMPREFGVVMEKVSNSAMDQAKWTDMQASIRGHVNNPGVRVTAGVLYVAEAQMVGVDGDVGLSAEGEGTGTGPSDEAREAILRGDNSAIKEAIAKAIERLIAGDAPTSQPANP